MSYFVFEGVININCPFEIDGEEATHILQSRRVKTGQVIQVQDQTQKRYLTQFENKTRRSVILRALEPIETPPEPTLQITLYQAIVKEKAMDNIIQKTTELGVSSIVFFHSDYSQNSDGGAAKKLARWQRIAVEACKQSGRVQPPNLALHPSSVSIAQLPLDQGTTCCLSMTEGTQAFSSLQPQHSSLNLVIGPEGGWSRDEETRLQPFAVHLGPRTLRADTAAIAAVSFSQIFFGDGATAPDRFRNPQNVAQR